MTGTLMPNVRTTAGFSVAARRYEPSCVFSMISQIAMQTKSEKKTTQPR